MRITVQSVIITVRPENGSGVSLEIYQSDNYEPHDNLLQTSEVRMIILLFCSIKTGRYI